jgi:alpha-methylacyl-CoA racemase
MHQYFGYRRAVLQRLPDGRRWLYQVGAIEPQFYSHLLDVLGLAGDERFSNGQNDRALWPWMKARLTEIFATRTRAEWFAAFDGRDACVAPVWSIEEAAEEQHMRERHAFVTEFGIRQPAPAPRFSLTPAVIGGSPATPGLHIAEVLREWGAPVGDADDIR